MIERLLKVLGFAKIVFGKKIGSVAHKSDYYQKSYFFDNYLKYISNKKNS